MSILEKAGLVDPEKVYDNKGHVKSVLFREFSLYPDKIEPEFKSEIERHLNWCGKCRERQKEQFLPIEDK